MHIVHITCQLGIDYNFCGPLHTTLYTPFHIQLGLNVQKILKVPIYIYIYIYFQLSIIRKRNYLQQICSRVTMKHLSEVLPTREPALGTEFFMPTTYGSGSPSLGAG